jgi:hypothetical protein
MTVELQQVSDALDAQLARDLPQRCTATVLALSSCRTVLS